MILAPAGTFKHNSHAYHDKSWDSTNVPGLSFLPGMVAGLLGVGLVNVAYADAPEVCMGSLYCGFLLSVKYTKLKFRVHY